MSVFENDTELDNDDTELDQDILDEIGEEFYEVDFDKVNPPAGKYPAVIERVEYKVTENENGTSRGLQILLKLDTSEYEQFSDWDGMFIPSYLWLGRTSIDPMALRRIVAFLEAATGEKPKGKINWKRYGLSRNESGKLVLSSLEGLSVGVDVGVKTGKDDIERFQVNAYIQASKLKPLENKEEPF